MTTGNVNTALSDRNPPGIAVGLSDIERATAALPTVEPLSQADPFPQSAAWPGFNFDGYQTLTDLLDRACRDFPDRPAFSQRGCRISYQQLDADSRAFAAYLRHATGLEPGDRFALMLPNLLQYPIAFFGALRAGLVVVNINPHSSSDELRYLLCDAGVRGMLTITSLVDQIEALLGQNQFQPPLRLETLILTGPKDALRRWQWPSFGFGGDIQARPGSGQLQCLNYRRLMREGRKLKFDPLPLAGGDLALLQYTGGTTGRPKGAMLSHHNLLANVLQVRRQLVEASEPGAEILVAALPLYHIFAFTVSCLLMSTIGAEVILISDARNPARLVRQLKRVRPSLFIGLNTLFSALARQPEFSRLDFSRMKWSFSGGMALLPAVADRWQQLTGSRILEGYGMTETAPIISVNPPDAIRAGTLGLPITGTQIRVLDEEGDAVPVGGCGELSVRGPQVMQGYWQRPAETRVVLGSDGWLKTGDLVRVDADGYLSLVDRKKDMIDVGGFNVYPNEIEALMLAHPDIDDCAVIGVPDPERGEQVKLFVVTGNAELSVQQIRRYCRERLSPYKVPSQVEFRRQLPKNAIGKALRQQLREQPTDVAQL